MKFQGHTKSVEDCVFNPDHQALLASVGDDCDLMVWDARTGTKPVAVVRRLHATDINAIDWNRLDANFLVTGASDKLIKIVDMRLLSDDDVPIGRAPKVRFPVARLVQSAPVLMSCLAGSLCSVLRHSRRPRYECSVVGNVADLLCVVFRRWAYVRV